MNKNKKGFTLVELMAVLIILILILLIAVNRVRHFRKEANKKTITANTLKYIKAIDDKASTNVLEDQFYKQGLFDGAFLEENGVKLSGTTPDSALVCLSDYKVDKACVEYSNNQVIYENGKVTKIGKGDCRDIKKVSCSGDVIAEYDYTGSYKEFTAPYSGKYKIELWGAAGGTGNLIAKGAYTSGILSLDKGEKIYFYVGQQTVNNAATFNGGASCGSNCSAGGGATDVRITSGTWSDTASLASRIMVAAGGGGHNPYSSGYRGGYGGGLSGVTGAGDSPTTGATQIAGGISSGNVASKNGTFGKGGSGENWGGGGGGGYWGGAGGKNSGTGNGGGSGSSYVSGYLGCVGIKSETEIEAKDGCSSNPTIECSHHYSGKIFDKPIIFSGNEEMPTFDGTSTMTGNSTNGHAKISRYNFSDNSSSDVETFAYTGNVQTYTAPKNGKYKLEVWGAQGGSYNSNNLGGYGGYSVGYVNLNAKEKLYIYVGGSGDASIQGYNGGGSLSDGSSASYYLSAGGGATHIAKSSGLLSTFSENLGDLLIVAGGGGGTSNYGSSYAQGGHGGGYIGGSPQYIHWNSSPANSNETGGTQEPHNGGGKDTLVGCYNATEYSGATGERIGTFGQGGTGGGGGGFYGGTVYGACDNVYSGSGGSGYIGNSLLSNKEMYCYNCSESTNTNTKTTTTTCTNASANEKCAKIGNGAAKISLVK